MKTLKDIQGDPKFAALSRDAQAAVLERVKPGFSGLSTEAQDTVLSRLIPQQPTQSSEQPLQGSATKSVSPQEGIGNLLKSAGGAIGNVAQAAVNPQTYANLAGQAGQALNTEIQSTADPNQSVGDRAAQILPLAKFLPGAAEGVRGIANGVWNLLPDVVNDYQGQEVMPHQNLIPELPQAIQDYEKRYPVSTFAGEQLPYAIPFGEAAQVGKAGSLLKAAGEGAAIGALQDSPNGLQGRLENAAVGAALPTALGAAGHLLKGHVSVNEPIGLQQLKEVPINEPQGQIQLPEGTQYAEVQGQTAPVQQALTEVNQGQAVTPREHKNFVGTTKKQGKAPKTIPLHKVITDSLSGDYGAHDVLSAYDTLESLGYSPSKITKQRNTLAQGKQYSVTIGNRAYRFKEGQTLAGFLKEHKISTDTIARGVNARGAGFNQERILSMLPESEVKTAYMQEQGVGELSRRATEEEAMYGAVNDRANKALDKLHSAGTMEEVDAIIEAVDADSDFNYLDPSFAKELVELYNEVTARIKKTATEGTPPGIAGGHRQDQGIDQANPGQQVAGFVQNVQKAKLSSPELKQALDQQYQKANNKETLLAAQAKIESNPEAAYDEVLNTEEPTHETYALAQDLMRRYQNEGNFDRAIEIAERVAERATKQGQAIQALSMWGRLTPEGALVAAQRLANKGVTPDKIAIRELQTKYDEVVAALAEARKTRPVRKARVSSLKDDLSHMSAGDKTAFDSKVRSIKSKVNKMTFEEFQQAAEGLSQDEINELGRRYGC